MEHRTAFGKPEVERVGQSDGEHARGQPLLEREPGTEVRRERYRPEDLGQAESIHGHSAWRIAGRSLPAPRARIPTLSYAVSSAGSAPCAPAGAVAFRRKAAPMPAAHTAKIAPMTKARW